VSRHRAGREASSWSARRIGRLLGLTALLAVPALANCQPRLPAVIPAPRPWWLVDTFFAFHSAALEAKERERLLSVALKPLQRQPSSCPFPQWIVVGHADVSEGSPARTNQLGLRRADYVAQLLIRHGAQPRNVCTFSKGPTQPLSKFPPWKNARVEVESQCLWAPFECPTGQMLASGK